MNGRKQLAYHYTSLDVFLKLVEGVKYGYFRFHGSYIFSMNDPTEFKKGFMHIWKLLPQIEEELSKNYLIDDERKLSLIWNGDKTNSTKWWLNYHIEKLKDSYSAPFVISFSNYSDFLPQWTTYGDGGKGVSLGFDLQEYLNVIDDNGHLKPYEEWYDRNELHAINVVYDKLSTKHPIVHFIKRTYIRYLNILNNKSEYDNQTLFKLKLDAIEQMMIYSSSLIKHRAYEYEKEARVMLDKMHFKDVRFKKNTKGVVIPYIFIGVPVNKLKIIVVGPCADYDSVKLMIDTLFAQRGIKDVKIVKSNVPYR